MGDTFDVDEIAAKVTEQLLPSKSKKKYEIQYAKFVKWCNGKKIVNYTENVLLVYFSEELKSVCSASLWAYYSMLKSTLNLKHDVDISKYPKLIAFLKRKNVGYKPKKAKVLTTEQLDKFLTEAPDNQYLMMKVALILGVAGACRGIELTKLSLNDVTDLGSTILFTISNTKNNIERNFVVKNSKKNAVGFVELCKKYMALRKPETGHSRFFVQLKDGECTTQPVGKNTLAKVPQNIAAYLNLPHPSEYTGHSFRRTSASLLADSGASVDILKRHGGWKSATVAEGYVENSVNNKKDIAEQIFGHQRDIRAAVVPTTSSVPSVYGNPPTASFISASHTIIRDENQPMFNILNCTDVNITVHVHQSPKL